LACRAARTAETGQDEKIRCFVAAITYQGAKADYTASGSKWESYFTQF
jgi:hypothetical protein